MHFLRDMHIKNLKIPMFYYTRRIYEMKKKKPYIIKLSMIAKRQVLSKDAMTSDIK